VLSPIWLTKPETARRLKQRMKVVFDWAKAAGHRTNQDNPTEGITKALPRHTAEKRHHAALPYQEVPAFLATLQQLPDISASVRLGLELLILTALRTTEVQRAEWNEFDLEAGVWTVPAVRMKGKRDHRVPLSPRALEVVREAATLRQADSRWVFPGSKRGHPLSNMTFLKAARRCTTATLTTHGFRSSFRVWSAERTNAPRDVCESALAHVVKDKVEAAYRRTDLFDKRRALMEQWARFVTATPADVVTLRA
jgi:integrase